MNIADVLNAKASGPGTQVYTIAPDEPVTTLLHSLAEHNVGALIVVEDGAVAGIVSERDVVRRLADQSDGGPGALTAAVRDIMTTSVVTCSPNDNIDTVAETMTQRRIRHMPVLDGDGKLIGVVSIGDVVFSRMQQLEKDRGQLEQYITG